jgi:hypothetical protein
MTSGIQTCTENREDRKESTQHHIYIQNREATQYIVQKIMPTVDLTIPPHMYITGT